MSTERKSSLIKTACTKVEPREGRHAAQLLDGSQLPVHGCQLDALDFAQRQQRLKGGCCQRSLSTEGCQLHHFGEQNMRLAYQLCGRFSLELHPVGGCAQVHRIAGSGSPQVLLVLLKPPLPAETAESHLSCDTSQKFRVQALTCAVSIPGPEHEFPFRSACLPILLELDQQ